MRSSIIFIFFSLLLVTGCGTRPEYYRETRDDRIFWNPARTLTLSFPGLVETNGLTATIRTSSNTAALMVENIRLTSNLTSLSFNLPAGQTLPEGTYSIKIAANGHVLTNNLLIVDSSPPSCRIVGLSPSIKKGGTALIVVEANDPYLKHPFFLVKDEGRFFTQPFRRDGLYAGFIVWPVQLNNFDVSVIAQDRAGNACTNAVPILRKKIKYPVSYIPVDNEFHNDKLEEFGENATNRNLTEEERYAVIIKGFQEKKGPNIVDLTSRKTSDKFNESLFIPFDPLTNAKLTSLFGEHRYFLMKKRTVRNSYHLGLDMARSTNAPIFVSDAGTVVFSGYNGANGNMVLVYHGGGLYSLYAHCSRLLVSAYERVRPGQMIAISGKTGYALGDHLHFSVIIQGRYANPTEWMDPSWVRENVTDILENIR